MRFILEISKTYFCCWITLLLLFTHQASFSQACNYYPSTSNASGCAGGVYTLYATTFGGSITTHNWYTAQTGGTSVGGVSVSNPGSGIVQSTLTQTFNTSVTYWVEAMCPTGIASARVSVNFYVNAPTTISYSYSTDPLALGPADQLTLTASGGSSYEWRYLTSTSQPIAYGSTYSPTKGGAHYLKGTTSCGQVQSVLINVNHLPYVDAGSDKSIGLPSSFIVNGTGADEDGDAITYAWYIVGTTSSFPTMSATNTSSLVLTNILPGTHTFRLTVTDSWGKSSSDDVSVTASTLTNNYNYVQSDVVLVPNITSATQIPALTVTDKSTSLTYADALGRTVQSIGKQSSPLTKDLVATTEYDALGRASTSYLPIASTQATGFFIPNVLGNGTYLGSIHQNFYNNASDKIADDAAPYSTATFELSPLGRTLQQGSVGTGFQPTNSRAEV